MSKHYLTCRGLLPIFSEVCDSATAQSMLSVIPSQAPDDCESYIICKTPLGLEFFQYEPTRVIEIPELTESCLNLLETEALQSKTVEAPSIVCIDEVPNGFPSYSTITDLVKSCDSFNGKKILKLRSTGEYLIVDSELKVVESDGQVKIAEVYNPEEKKEAEESIKDNPDAKVEKDEDGNIIITDSDKDSYTYRKEGEGYVIVKNGQDAYRVSKNSNGGYTCTCTGYKYRNKCRHIEAISAMESKRKPRSVVEDFLPEIERIFKPIGKFEVVGSYRRGLPTVKDVDILVQCSPEEFKKVLEEFQKDENYEHVMAGNDIIRGLYNGMDMDVTRVNEGEWGSYLLYRTGSASFNIKMRADAKKRGWKLNEHGLFDENGDLLASETEEEIFESLGMDYVEPKNRK